MFCGHCGAKVSADAKFCPSCGAPIRTPVHAQPQPAPAYTAPAPATAPGGVLSGSSGIVFLKLLGFGVLFWVVQNLAFFSVTQLIQYYYGRSAYLSYLPARSSIFFLSIPFPVFSVVFVTLIHHYFMRQNIRIATVLFRILISGTLLLSLVVLAYTFLALDETDLSAEYKGNFLLYIHLYGLSCIFSNLFLSMNLMIVRENRPWLAILFSGVDFALAILIFILCSAIPTGLGIIALYFSHIILFLVTLWYFTLRKKTQLRLFGSPRHI